MSMAWSRSAVLVAMVATEVDADELELGGFAGASSTRTLRTRDCVPTARCTFRSDSDETVGLSLGAYVRYPFVRAISIEANLLYVQKGYDASPEVRFHYLEAPLLIRVSPLPAHTPARLAVFAGVAPAVRIGCRASGVAFDNEINEPYSYSGSCDDAPFPPTPSRFDLGGVIGAGAAWSFPFGVIEIQARFVRGLVDIGGHPDTIETVNDGVYVFAGFGKTLDSP